MKFRNRIFSRLGVLFENMAKARVNSTLLSIDRQQLQAWGYSYEALQRGPSAWPWRLDDGPLEAGLPSKATLVPPSTRIDIDLDGQEIRRDAA